MNLAELGNLVRARREALGLSQQQLARMASLSRTTINLLEAGKLTDLGIVKVSELLELMGLSLQAEARTDTHVNAAVMASRTASVSYRDALTPEELLEALSTGKIPPERVAHVATLIDEAPLSLVVSSVEMAARQSAVPPKHIWKHVRDWAKTFHSPRKVWV
jgi:transcriptional regulator with XRE-family HTH domain